MLMTHGLETHLLNDSSLKIPFVSWVLQLLFWQFILKIDFVIFSEWKVREGWYGGGVGGEPAVTKEPDVTCTYLRVVSDPAQPYNKRKIPLSGWWFAQRCIQESLWICFSWMGLLFSLLPPLVSSLIGSLLFICSFIQSSYLLSSYCMHKTVPRSEEKIRGELKLSFHNLGQAHKVNDHVVYSANICEWGSHWQVQWEDRVLGRLSQRTLVTQQVNFLVV